METAKLNVESADKAKATALSGFLHACKKKLVHIFEPEEVEVYFEEDHGKVVSYTYTVVDHKEVA